MSHIFMSYSRKDSPFVSALSAQLRRSGFRMWVDRDNIRGGVFWDDTVEDAIKNAACVVAVLSDKFTKSENVKDEISFAKERNIQIIPILIEDVQSIPFRLGRIQHIDFRKNYDEALQQLTKNIPIEASLAYKATEEEVTSESSTISDDDASLNILFPEDRLAAHEGGSYVFPKLVFQSASGKQVASRDWIMKVSNIIIGRMNTCDIILEHDQISRKHAQIYLENGVYWVRDLGSSNGTKVNGKAVIGDGIPLKDNDQINLGDVYTLLFSLEPATDVTLPRPPRK